MTDFKPGSSENQPYLGDPQIVSKLLQGIARESIQCRIASKQGILTPEDANAIEEKEAASAARALLGRDKKYAVDATWNQPGAIDSFVKTELNLEDKGAEPILTAGLLKFIGEVQQRLNLIDNPSQNPKAENEIADIVEKYRNVLLGLSLAATPLTATAPELTPVPLPPKPVAPVNPTTPAAPVQGAPIISKPPVAPAPSAPAVAPTPVAAAPANTERSGGWLKWAALLILLLVIGGVAFFVMNKPAKETVPVVAKQEPVKEPVKETAPTKTSSNAPVRVVTRSNAAAPVLNANGTIDLVEESGKSVKTITLKDGKKIVHVYDAVRVDGKSSFLVATDDSNDTYNVWLIDESGAGREVVRQARDAKLAPSGKRLAYVTLQHVLTVEENEKQIATAEDAHDFAWGPDSESIVYLRAGDGHSLSHPTSFELARLQLADKKIVTLTGGFYDNVRPMIQPDGTIFLVAGSATGLPSFWKVEATGSEPKQITNVRLDETNDSWVPTPFSTAQWSADGRWLIYDYKQGSLEQIWGLEFDKTGAFKRSVQIADGLLPRWINGGKFVCLKNVGGSLQANVHTVPES